MSAIAHLLTDAVTYQRRNGVSNGDPSWGSQSTLSARVEHRTKYSADGQARLSDHVLVTTTELERGDRVWLPGDDTNDNGHARLVREVKQAGNPSGGLTVYEVML